MCGSSKQTTKSSQETRALQPYGTTYDNILNKANTAANAAYDPTTEARVAGFSAPQTQAFGQVQNNLGSYQPYMAQAGQNIDYSAAPVTGSDINNYMDPYLQNVVDMAQNTFDTQNARAAQQLKGEMARRSPVMGSGRDVAAALQSEANQNAQNPIIAQLYSQGFGQAQQAAQADKNRALSAGQAQGNLGGLAQSYGYNDVNALLGVGGMQQDLTQAEYDANSANAMARASYPMDMINWQSQIATGLGGAAGSTSSGTSTATQKSNPLQQIVGGAIGGLGILSKMKTGGFALGGGVSGHSYVPKASEMTNLAPGGQTPSIGSQTAPATDGGFSGMLENYKQGRELMDSLNGLGKSPAEANGWTTTAHREGYATKGGVWPSEQDDGGLGNVFSNLGAAMPLVSPNATGGMDAGPPRIEQAASPQPTGLFGMSDAASDGFISAGFGMMGANGPNWFGQGAQQGFKSYQGSKESQAEAAVRKLQQDRLTAQANIQQAEADRATAASPYELRMKMAQAQKAEQDLARKDAGELREVNGKLVRIPAAGDPTVIYDAGRDPSKAPAGWRFSADGTQMEPIPGGPADKKTEAKYSEGASKAANFGNMMVTAEQQLAELAKGDELGIDVEDPNTKEKSRQLQNPLGFFGSIREAITPEAAANYARSPAYRQYRQAAMQWVRAKLRKESGAQISPSEFEGDFQTYFPQPGDDPETIAQKKAARDEATRGMVAESRGAYDTMFAQEGLRPGPSATAAKAAVSGAQQAKAAPQAQYKEGDRLRNAQGEEIELRGNQWVPVQ